MVAKAWSDPVPVRPCPSPTPLLVPPALGARRRQRFSTGLKCGQRVGLVTLDVE